MANAEINTNYLPYLHFIYNLIAPLGAIGILVLLCWTIYWFLKFKLKPKDKSEEQEEEKNGKSKIVGNLTETEKFDLLSLRGRIEQYDSKFRELETVNATLKSIIQQDTARWDTIMLKLGELSGKVESLMNKR